jgi:hypothetical protein
MGERDREVEVGYETITLSKVHGPLIFNNIRIRAAPDDNTWVIEREMYSFVTSEEADAKSEIVWQEWIRIPGQLRGDGDNVIEGEDES